MDATMSAMIYAALVTLVAPAAACVVAIAFLILLYQKLSDLFTE